MSRQPNWLKKVVLYRELIRWIQHLSQHVVYLDPHQNLEIFKKLIVLIHYIELHNYNLEGFSIVTDVSPKNHKYIKRIVNLHNEAVLDFCLDCNDCKILHIRYINIKCIKRAFFNENGDSLDALLTDDETKTINDFLELITPYF